MHLHQVLTGAVNPGDNCYSVGSVEDIPFTAYGSGCDIVILANDFECVQIIPGAKHGNIQVSCVECSQQQGRIAASYGNAVCIFEPLGINSHKRNCQLKCQWLKTGQFFLSSMTYNLAWDPQGNRLLTATDFLQLWAPPSSDILEEVEDDDPVNRIKDDKVLPVLNDWKCVWQCKTAVSVHLMAWSPDGEYFATAGKDDCLLKVWYPMTGWKSSLLPQENEEKKKCSEPVNFSFVYLAHPRAVTGFSWRNISKYMPRGLVCNVLLTSCLDGICRLWAETLLPEDTLLGEQICETSTSSISTTSQTGKQKDKIQHALETIHHLKNMRKGQRRSSVLVTHTDVLPDQQGTHEVQRHISHHANALGHFHIAASINPSTDIPSVLAGTAFNIDEGNGGFVVHWLNNKEFNFTSSIEVFMQHLRKLSEQQIKHDFDVEVEEKEEMEEKERGLHMKLDHDLSIDRESETGTGTGSSEHEDGEREGSPKTSLLAGPRMALPTVLLDRKIELLLTEWNRNPDMLFTIHPVDGTFLVWHVKYLDEHTPGIFRQVQVSFSSRIPVAFPSGDASSLSKNIMMYACPVFIKDNSDATYQKTMDFPDNTLANKGPSLAQDSAIISPIVMMISKHIDGSLNQWAVTFADKSAFTTVLTVSHKFRYCGHRFHLNDLACHSVLPLLLTSSHHNALLTPESDSSWDSDRINRIMDPLKHVKGSPRQQIKNAATRTFHDPNAIYSELILWRVDPIGPLSYTGGVSELARINSLHTSAFSNVAWLPTLIPSYCLGTYCNSASACFVASDGTNLRLYQAVVDARKLLDELSDPESSKLIGEVFNIVSQQSTARPGCIIELDAITNKCGSNTQLLHVFQEDFILGYKPHKEDLEGKETEIFFQPSQGYRPPSFSEKFYLVVIEKDTNGCSILQMWHLHLKSVQACLGLSTCHFAWAFHSEAEEELINMIPAIQKGDPQWSELRAMGIGWWVRNINTLRRCIEKVAKASFQRNNDALDAALFYLAMKKKAVVWGLFRSQHDEKMTAFFSHNFSEDRWRKAALKNAFALLGKQRFEQSAAFFLLAGSLKDAIEVCLEKMEDIQLAMVIARLYESEFETSVTYTSILYEKILGCHKDGSGFSCTKLHSDPFLRSIAYWIMKDYTRALDTLLEQTPKEDDENPVIVKSCNPVVFSFYNYLRTHPLLIRRYFSSPEGTLATLGLKTEKSFVDKINLIERKLFFTTANAHFKVGCPVLALEVLSKIPKVRKKSTVVTEKDSSSPLIQAGVSDSKALGDGAGSADIDWSKPISTSFALENTVESSSQFDWSQPAVKFDDEPLTLDWGDDKNGSDEEDKDVGIMMKNSKSDSKNGNDDERTSETNIQQTAHGATPDAGDTEVDVIAEQLKFRACLKILMTELRTLATGYEVDGGKLRFQLYNWLEKEIAAMHEICNHDAGGKDYCKTYTKVNGDLLEHDDIMDKPDIGSYERHQIERRRLQAKREHAERRKWWLQKNQALLRVFLSYCSLHGAQGGGLASVRMELKFLLQESQQETTVKQLQSPLPLPTTLPLLSASIASTKTVIANPVLYLNNHIHDILYTIVQMKSPPHPNVEDVKVYTLHSLAASLSASIYQALCDSHSYSQTEANQFTGMVYQGLLLSDRRRLRTESIEEHATPNSSPAQWPGVSSLINLLSSAQDEDQPKLNILLCEAVIAVYLSLLIHALATNSCNELFRLAAHPLNTRMWAAVFGGGVKLLVKPRRQSENIPAPPLPSEEMDKHRRRFNMRMLVPGRPVKDSTVPPPVPAERPSYKEKFIPPELSMWDYFMAKPFLPLSDSGVIYDSDESIHSDEEEDDAFLSDVQIQEHKDANSYSWALLHLTMVKLVLHNVKNFFPIAGLEFTDLPVTSPLGIAVVKNLEHWEQILQDRMDQFEGPPPNYINTYPSDLGVGAGPALLRNKAMIEPENTPFKSKDYSALPAKRLWHFLVKQELLQETFIRYIFTKKRKQSEVEADLGYPGGKAKIIHKESDMIMAFAVNKANSNEIVLASTHDVQELDISALLAAQSFIWIGEEYDRESKSSDDDFRGSTTTLTQSTAPSFGVHQIQPSSSMPWLGSGQTSTGAGVLIKRNLNNVKRMASHPVHQYYLTGAQDGSVRMFEWTRPQQLVCFQQAGNARVTRMYFNSQGNKCGVADGEGFLSIWQVNQTTSNPKPYLNWQCHSKTTSDFAFITSSSLVATSGQSNDNRNVCLWDTLVSSANSLIHAFTCHDHGATVLQYAPKHQLLISGGRKGYICIFDIRQRQILYTFQAHESAVKALALDPSEDYFITGSAEGNMKVWRLTGYNLIHSFKNEHAKQSIFRNIGAGVTQIETVQGNRIFSCGADGTLKMRVLPNAFNVPSGIFDIL
ncbi:dmX-like protein 2 isoform X7 [Indicator indicator]|uniref:dmX-like protein 2 isoform X7 n=1 Tax=Indicator indicator TaxID=1002788 RepID=UPI0023DFA14B|nr:dmX-like protein 2 isoform X7 [Indicator indicator]